MDESEGFSVQCLVDIVREIYSMSDFKGTIKKPYYSLSRRLKLLMPMMDEIKESKQPIPVKLIPSLKSLQKALESARELLKFGSEASKIYLALERNRVMKRYFEVTEQLEQALCGISYDKLDISDEIMEQVELVIVQFKRAKGRVEPPDDELYNDLSSLYNKSIGSTADAVILRRVAEKLQLMGIDELMQESVALHEMVSTSGDLEVMERMYVLLKMIKEFVHVETPDMDSPSLDSSTLSNAAGEASSDQNNSPIIPNDFRCPISLELMKDPVIVATGQTYERACIEKWLDAGHNTCPKTQLPLSSFTLTPNYVLRSLIAQWCELHGLNPPKLHRPPPPAFPVERSKIESLLRKLASGLPPEQRSAAGEIRLLAKRNAANRVAIAEAGAVPLLARHLSSPDPRTQEHAVTALLNLSICDDNKGTIISSGAVPGIVHVLKNGSTEARENAAATLFSLSVVDENKVLIGGLGAIPPLVALLNEGTPRGKKDAATALFNLCIYQGNKGKAVRAGVVPTLMQLLTEPVGGMVDESLAILAILASHPDGKASIGAAEAVPVLVEIIKGGSPRNRENAAAILVNLCAADPQIVEEAQKLGVMDPLADLAVNGTDRGKRKAVQLLERMTQFHHTVLLQTLGSAD